MEQATCPKRVVLVVAPYYWGSGETKKEAVKVMRKAGFTGRLTQFCVYSAVSGTRVDGMGGLVWPGKFERPHLVEKQVKT